MSIFGVDIIHQSIPLESIVANMKSIVKDQLREWNTDLWYFGMNHSSEYMKPTLEKFEKFERPLEGPSILNGLF